MADGTLFLMLFVDVVEFLVETPVAAQANRNVWLVLKVERSKVGIVSRDSISFFFSSAGRNEVLPSRASTSLLLLVQCGDQTGNMRGRDDLARSGSSHSPGTYWKEGAVGSISIPALHSRRWTARGVVLPPRLAGAGIAVEEQWLLFEDCIA